MNVTIKLVPGIHLYQGVLPGNSEGADVVEGPPGTYTYDSEQWLYLQVGAERSPADTPYMIPLSASTYGITNASLSASLKSLFRSR